MIRSDRGREFPGPVFLAAGETHLSRSASLQASTCKSKLVSAVHRAIGEIEVSPARVSVEDSESEASATSGLLLPVSEPSSLQRHPIPSHAEETVCKAGREAATATLEFISIDNPYQCRSNGSPPIGFVSTH